MFKVISISETHRQSGLLRWTSSMCLGLTWTCLALFTAATFMAAMSGCSNSVNTSDRIGGVEFAESDATVNDDDSENLDEEKRESETSDMTTELATATFGNGCYWCTEAVFQRVKGVKSVVSGFSGGDVKDPTYYEVCDGTTGHAEVLQITYDPNEVSFEKLLEVFWKTHDPTTLNRQGNDVGTQYRSAVFYHDDQQKELAEKYRRLLDDSGAFNAPIVTEITKFDEFYPAPDAHQNYYNENKELNPYCRMIQIKLDKFRKAFADVIDEEKDVIK